MRRMIRYKTMMVKDGSFDYKYDVTIKTPENIEDILRGLGLQCSIQEELWVIYVNNKMKIMGLEMVSKGGMAETLINPCDVFRGAIVNCSTGIIMAHNHPSGDTTPSTADISTTVKIVNFGSSLGINVIDSVIIGENSFSSLKRLGYI